MLLTAVQLISLALFLGPPLFYLYVWRAASAEAPPLATIRDQVYLLSLAGAAIYILSGLGLVMYAFRAAPPGVYLPGLLKLVMAALYVFCFRKLAGGVGGICRAGMVAAGTAVLLLHAAADAGGLLPWIASSIHLAAASAWGGMLLSLILLVWSGAGRQYAGTGQGVWRMAHGFSGFTIVSLVLIILAGVILKTVNVYGDAAMAYTAYGQTLGWKISATAVLLGLLFVELMWVVPALKKNGDQAAASPAAFGRYRALMTMEAATLAGLLLVTSNLVPLEPPDTAPFLNPQSWTMPVDGMTVRVDMQPVAGNPADARFEIFLPGAEAGGAAVSFDLQLPGRDLGFDEVEALQASANSYLGEASFPAPGEWRFRLSIDRGGVTAQGAHALNVPAQPLVEDIRTYFSLSAVSYRPGGWITLLTGLLLVAVYARLVWQSRKGRVPLWVAPAGLAAAGLGFHLVLGVSLVKTYPSTFWQNPEPYDAVVIGRGRAAYQAQCADCHGGTGEGDGPWALRRGGGLPDLAAPHMDVHTDGEIYWWITHGIPSLDMPPLADELDEGGRWAVINYVRSLRHGIP